MADIRNQRELLERLRGKRLNDQLVGMVNQEKAQAEAEFANYYRRCKIWYDLYRGIYTQNYAGFRNNVSIPFLYSIVQSDVARKVQISLGRIPYVNFEGYPPEEEAIARKNDILICAQMEDMDIYKKAVDFFLCMDLYGVGIMRDGWRQDLRYESVRVPTYMPNRETLVTEKQVWNTYFDGPDGTVVDPLDFFPQVGFRYINDMEHALERYWRDLDDLWDQVSMEVANGEEPFVDIEALKEVERSGMSLSGEAAMVERLSYARNATAWTNRGKRFRKPVEIWERWGTVPTQYAPDGNRRRKIIVLNGRVLGKNIPMPYHHGQLPWTSCSIGDPHYFHGVGKTELLSKMQAAANRIMNHKLDTLDISISPATIIGANTGIDSSRPLVMGPGAIIQSETATVGDDVIRPLFPNMQGMQAANAELGTLWAYMQQGSGIIEDVVTGGQSAAEQTAREYQGRQEAVMTRLGMESRLAEKNWLEPFANKMRAYNRQYLNVPKQIHMIGSQAVVDPVTKESVVELDYGDLWPSYKARAVGASQNMLRTTQRQDVMQFVQVAAGVPELMQQVNWGAFAREFFNDMGFRNVDRLIQELQPGLPDQINGAVKAGQIPAPNSGPMGNPENLSGAALGPLKPLGG